MARDDRSVAPAVRDSLALAELAEFAERAPHLDFGLARRRAIADALLPPSQDRPDDDAAPTLARPAPLSPARKALR